MKAGWATFRNDQVRKCVRFLMYLIGSWFRYQVNKQIRNFRKDQENLSQAYGITPDTPIHPWGPYMQKRIDEFAARTPGTRFAYTSGSTAQPKKIAFPHYRLALLRKGSLSVASRMMLANRVDRMGLFILASLKEDDSLTSLILDDQGKDSPYLVGLLMPGKYFRDQCIRELVKKYGATGVRLWMMTLSDPGIVYSTNPSTLAQFLISLKEEWKKNSQLVRDFTENANQFPSDVIRVARRITGTGWKNRLDLITNASECPPMEQLFPGLRKYCCWDGGYVRPFLEQIRAFLKPQRVQLIPMYSMSTESVETLNVFEEEKIHFLPIAPRVLYEFLPEGKEDLPENLLPGWELEEEKLYSLVLSDPYGLQRYQTEDLFLCKGFCNGLPDLHFMRRRGLTFSFTGEKLTGEQITEAYDGLRKEFPSLADIHLTCIPSRPANEKTPFYRVVIAHPGNRIPENLDEGKVGERFDTLLSGINEEFAAKRESDRLGKTRIHVLPYDLLATHLDAKTSDSKDVQQRAWDSQFKLLPLYRKMWEELGLITE